MQPNILFILTDDQRYNTIHALGCEDIHTPNMDALVESGCAFTQAHIPCGTVGAVCMPSRGMIHSGRTLFHLKDDGTSIPETDITLGETLRDQGYFCFGTGKWHNGPAAFNRSFDDGDNFFFGGMWDHWNVPCCHYDPTGKYDNVIHFTQDFMHANKTEKVHCDQFNAGVHSTQFITDTAVKAIHDCPKDKPLFLYTAYLAPHDPRTMPEEFLNMYNPDDITLPESFTEVPFDYGVRKCRDENLAAFPRDPQEVRRHIAEYYGMISHLDSEIGRMINTLKEEGLYDNTIIILAGDNGLALGYHGLMGKQNAYEHSVRVPLVISGKGIPKGVIREEYVYLLDIYPSICELLDITPPANVEGTSFVPAIFDKPYNKRESLYFAYSNILRAVKDEQYKLIAYRNFANCYQLYDLKNDPDELHDLANDPTYAEKIEELKVKLEEYHATWENTAHPGTVSYWGEQT